MELSQKYDLLVLTRKGLFALGVVLLIVLVILGVDFLKGRSKSIDLASLYAQEQIATREQALDKKRPLADYLRVFNARDVFKPGAKPTIKDLLAGVKEKWGIRLRGTIIDPDGPSVAFLIDKSGEEGIYYEGDTIGIWKIKSIQRNKVVLLDVNGGQTVLKIEAGSGVSAASRPSPGLSKPEPTLSELPLLTAEQLIPRIRPIIKSMSPEVVRERIEAITGIPREDIPPETNLTEYVTGLIEISQDGVLPEETGELIPISFSTKVNRDNSAQNPATIFTESDKRIYACFTNQGELKGLKNIITRWVNAADGSIVYIGTKSINPATSYNYVWLEKKKGWPKGTYTVQLVKTSDTKKVVAQGTFEIR